MGIYRLKHTFTAGELSPVMDARVDVNRFKNGSKIMENMTCLVQGPAIRRSGFKFVYDLNLLDLNVTNPKIRMIPFEFNEDQAYIMIFYDTNTLWDPEHPGVGYKSEMVLATSAMEGSDEIDGLVVYGSPPPTECPAGETIPDPKPVAGQIVVLELPSFWDNDVFDYEQSGDEMWITQPDLPIHFITRYDHTCWTLTDITASVVDAPDEWGPRQTNGFPERITFHQQRLVVASNTGYRQMVWCSSAGDFLDFSVEASPEDSDAITFILDSATQNKITWLQGGKLLQIGTRGNEWIVKGSDQDAVTPSNIVAERQTNVGGLPLKALKINHVTLFVERFGRAANEFFYDYSVNSHIANDMSVLAPHLTDNYSIIDWAYQQVPDRHVWSIREDGTLLGLTYQREHEVLGWHRHTTDGKFLQVAVIPGVTREDDLWVCVQREITVDIIEPGSIPIIETHFYLEKKADMFRSNDVIDGRFLDSYLVYDGEPISTVTGLRHLENKVVNILADGAVHPERTVVNAKITLDNAYSHVVVGIPYTSEVRPFLADLSLNDGTLYGRDQRTLNLNIALDRSLGMIIGKQRQGEEEITEDVAFRHPDDLMGVRVPLFTGIIQYTFMEGYDVRTEYFIRQEQPLPLTVVGVVDEVEVT